MAFLTSDISSGQVSFFVAFAWCVGAWIYSELLHWISTSKAYERASAHDDTEAGKLLAAGGTPEGGGAASTATELAAHPTAAAHLAPAEKSTGGAAAAHGGGGGGGHRYGSHPDMLSSIAHSGLAAALLKKVDEMPLVRRVVVRCGILAATALAAWAYYVRIYCLDKYAYNIVHPYTSWIPITLWIIVRNITPPLRVYHLRLYGWLGCITLETYICQFHVWMKTVVPDGQPKGLLALIPGYPLLNFALTSALYVLVSHRLFELTNNLKNAAVPHSNNSLLLRNTLMLLATGAALWGVVGAAYSLVV
ncbi:CAS1 domain-containing protein 1 [Tetrabaena socialis]|uniref:CAS1 domain-containing protein 1 n=1 Tax=Tetrabaena socialis TaxID=47790 RepID=A0A2J8A1Q1_9CHLO|nr:CAS1 domain-containing protein 1 [Tetrabaena socialis]|eukprot:PNH06447.1 CAS1 domain-containing protein 1 [Tetrabaena socialis]